MPPRRSHRSHSRRGAALALAALALAPASPALAQQQPQQPGGGNRGGAAGSEIVLAVGEQQVVRESNVRNYSVGSTDIAEVRVAPDGRIIVVGRQAGATTLLLIRGDSTQQTYAVTVTRYPTEVVRQQVTQLLQGYNGVTISQVGGRLFLEGGVASETQQRRVQQIAAIYPGQVESLVSVDPTIVERRINVRVDLYFVELSRNANYLFGINWPGQYGGGNANINIGFNQSSAMGPGMPAMSSLQTIATAVINQPLPRLDLASNAGWARVHRQATVVTANGNEATYHSGGEFITQVPGALGGGDIRRIEFGSTITLTPRFDPSTSRVDVRVQADLSDLTETGSVLPGRNIARVSTLVNLQLGQSIVLSGMRGRSVTAGSQGLIGLSQIPILGALFGGQTIRNRDNEMVIFVVPTVIEGMTRQAEDRVASALRAYEDFGGGVEDNVLVPRPAQPGGNQGGAAGNNR